MKSRTAKRWLRILTVIAVMLLVSFYFEKYIVRLAYQVYRSYFQRHNKLVSGHAFIFDFPKAYSIHGVDVSRYQDEIDWEKLYGINTKYDTVKIRFAFIKATEGIIIEDPMFAQNWKDAKQAGIVCGAYHYYKPRVSAKLQAENFISSVDLTTGDLPPVIDVEETGRRSKKELVKGVRVFATELEKEYGVKPIIYSNIKFIEDYLIDNFSDYQFWIANYYVDDLKPSPGIKWLFWQHHDKARLSGCNNLIDLNVFNGKKTDFEKIRLK